jgi:hypothetical protein
VNSRLLGILSGTTIFWLASGLGALRDPVRAAPDDAPVKDHAARPPAPEAPAQFVNAIHRSLAVQQDRMIEMANRVLQYEKRASQLADQLASRKSLVEAAKARFDNLAVQQDRMIEIANRLFQNENDPSQLEDQLASRKSLVEAAKARFDNARLAREIADLKVKEFTEGTFVQDLALAELEIKLAQEEVATAREETKRAEDELARIKKASTGSAGEISLEFGFEAKLLAAQLGERRAGYALEQATSKKKVLVEYTKEKRRKDLASDREKARSVELAKKAAWDLELAKSTKRETDRKQTSPSPDVKRSLPLLERAIAIQEEACRKLERLANQRGSTESLCKEIQDLASQLRAIVDQAAGELAVVQIDKLKRQIRAAADRDGDQKK